MIDRCVKIIDLSALNVNSEPDMDEDLQRLGANKRKAWGWAKARKSCTRTAHGHILAMALTNEHLAAQGRMTLSGEYRTLRTAA